ncbi:diguanylate cyclase [Fluviibacterium sp. DFM31]|uniref:diguanylate cyclase n=1 Tax=Meridianimarinicoccus marinus TaxID=3231483 RepID=A0ABV3L1R0_9RHOB
MTGRILIHDSVAVNRIVLRCKLAAACYDVQTVETRDAVFPALRGQSIDLLLLDSDDDPAATLAICREVTKRREGAAPAVLMTASAPCPEFQVDAVKAGAVVVLPKPVDSALLLASLRRCQRHMRAHAEALHQARGLHDLGMSETGGAFLAAHHIQILAKRPGRAESWAEKLRPLLRGHRITADHPDKALLAIPQGESPAVIVLAAEDLRQGESLSLLSDLRSRTVARDGRVVVVTDDSNGQFGTAAMALDLGADDVLLNGFDAHNLAVRIQAQMTQKQRIDQLRDFVQTGLRLAARDPLTGLYNRRFAFPRLERLCIAALESRTPLSILAMDMDRFKDINDTFGHSAGDAVLVEVAHRLTEAIRPQDLLIRSGGEEFILALPGTDRAGAHQLADRIGELIRRTPVTVPSASAAPIRVTISTGVAELTEDAVTAMNPMDVVLAQADKALYSAKADGRDTVVAATGYAA